MKYLSIELNLNSKGLNFIANFVFSPYKKITYFDPYENFEHKIFVLLNKNLLIKLIIF